MTLRPDDKDWTWVLQRACPECGFDPANTTREAFPAEIRILGGRWVVALSVEAPGRRTRENRWSILEYGCHVRDVFRLFDERLALILEEHDPTFANWDQDATAIEERYDLQDADVVAVELAFAARALADRYSTVHGEQWARMATRSNGSRFSAESLGIYLLHDPFHHLWDLTTL